MKNSSKRYRKSIYWPVDQVTEFPSYDRHLIWLYNRWPGSDPAPRYIQGESVWLEPKGWTGKILVSLIKRRRKLVFSYFYFLFNFLIRFHIVFKTCFMTATGPPFTGLPTIANSLTSSSVGWAKSTSSRLSDGPPSRYPRSTLRNFRWKLVHLTWWREEFDVVKFSFENFFSAFTCRVLKVVIIFKFEYIMRWKEPYKLCINS